MSLDAEAIQLIQQSQAISAASDALANTSDHLLALPQDWKLHDLEFAQQSRRRFRGRMHTELLPCFAAYVREYAEAENDPPVFVEVARMRAVAVLNMGMPGDSPGHADSTATYQAKASAAFAALQKICAEPRSQKDVAEWMEDWLDVVTAEDGEGQPIPIAQAVAAVRNITLDATKRVESSQQSLSAARSSFEQVTASSRQTLPAWLVVACEEPYIGLARRAFRVRVGVLTGETPKVQLRVAQAEKHAEQMAKELVTLVQQALPGARVMTGTFERGA